MLQKSNLDIPMTAGIVAFIYSIMFTMQSSISVFSAISTALIFDWIERHM